MECNDQSTFVYQNGVLDHFALELDEPKRIFFPGDPITGTVKCTLNSAIPSRVAIHLSCKLQMNRKRKIPLFKTFLQPLAAIPDLRFSIIVPEDVPSSVEHEHIRGSIIYKVKAVHELPYQHSSLWPKASAPVQVQDAVCASDEHDTATFSSEGQLTMTLPRDLIIKDKTFRKGDTGVVSARLSMRGSCFLPGQAIPFDIFVQHIIPIRQRDGIRVHLERVTTFTSRDSHEQTIDTASIQHITLPLSCNRDTFAHDTKHSTLVVPADTPPTLNMAHVPLQIIYRLRVAVNVDMDDHLLRKRDRLSHYMARKVSMDDQHLTSTSTIVLDLPVKIGTVQNKPLLSLSSTDSLVSDPQDNTLGHSDVTFRHAIDPPPEYSAATTTATTALGLPPHDKPFLAGAFHPPSLHGHYIPRQPSAPDLHDIKDESLLDTQHMLHDTNLPYSQTFMPLLSPLMSPQYLRPKSVMTMPTVRSSPGEGHNRTRPLSEPHPQISRSYHASPTHPTNPSKLYEEPHPM